MELMSININIFWFKDAPVGVDDARIDVGGAEIH
jgi:hypothetical protein